MQYVLTLMIEAICVTFSVVIFIDFIAGVSQLIQAIASVTPDNRSMSIPRVNKLINYQTLSTP
ncbi:hypothetical protein [Trichormus azollae]|jgi:hypothetical protein|uniref:Uncharacterized protein n=1 Tax=Nostoc azollae (strain 0708) TaxID=551115 RepID=D7E5M0_NOSA0|nr:hypothetical protein [Trichormus azollae]ADI66279.1 hypothetical protein Aazo_5273 ['Nostoc azollae' 0708]